MSSLEVNNLRVLGTDCTFVMTAPRRLKRAASDKSHPADASGALKPYLVVCCRFLQIVKAAHFDSNPGVSLFLFLPHYM